MPKSSSFTAPSAFTRMLEGLRSRWMTACRCACCTASHTARNSRSRSAREQLRARQYSVSGTPSTYSIANHGVPSGSIPASWSCAMAGMVQLRQRPLLAQEARPARGRDPAVAKELQRRTAAHVLALDEIDDAHPALAEQAKHPVRAHAPRRVGPEQVVGHLGQRPIEERAGRPVLDEQRLHLGHQRRVPVGPRLEERVLLGGGQVRRRVEEILDQAPACRACCGFSVSAGAHGPGRRGPRASRAARWPRRCRGYSQVSRTSSPPKKRLSTMRAWRGSSRASASSAVSRASTCSDPASGGKVSSSKVTIGAPPPRLRGGPATRGFHQHLAHGPRGDALEVGRGGGAENWGEEASLSHASFTSAVGLRVRLGSSRRTEAASRRSSA